MGQEGGGPTFSGSGTFAGHLAMRAGLNKPVEWDGADMICTNTLELDRHVKREYRQGWTL